MRCVLQKILEDVEDASSELMLSDEENVRYLIGECMVHLEKDEAEKKLEEYTTTLQKEVRPCWVAGCRDAVQVGKLSNLPGTRHPWGLVAARADRGLCSCQHTGLTGGLFLGCKLLCVQHGPAFSGGLGSRPTRHVHQSARAGLVHHPTISVLSPQARSQHAIRGSPGGGG